MARIPSIVFANLTCRFGSDYFLLDFAREVVLPAFTDSGLRRSFGPTSYFFLDVGIVDVQVEGTEDLQLTVYGRIVKDTILTRSQVYSAESGLIADEDSMASAPSSFFALDLNNHKLVFLPETAFAPSIAVFASTLQNFMRRKHTAFVRALYEVAKHTDEPKTLESLFREYPPPDVEATPMANKGSIQEFLNSFAKLTHLEFRILNTNAEIQRQQTFRELREMKDQLRATKTKLVHDSKEGLDIGVAAEEIDASASAGNQAVVLAGTAADGTELRGSNDNFKLRVSAADVPENPLARALHLVKEYFRQVTQGRLRPDQSEADTTKIDQLRESLNGSIERG
jgi:hypothetical protein